MTDQDHDGSHIKGLLINFLHHFWPSLLKIKGFLQQFITPIVKCIKGKKEQTGIFKKSVNEIYLGKTDVEKDAVIDRKSFNKLAGYLDQAKKDSDAEIIVGGGYNEYNKIENLVKIVRKGFPGQNREILLTYPLSSVQSIGIKISEGLNPQRSIYLCLKDERRIPLTQVQQPESISSLEKQAADLAKFLDLKLENL
mgnify:CR=1 FL=1